MKKDVYILLMCNPDKGSGVEKVVKEVGEALYKSGKYSVNYVFSGNNNFEKVKSGIKYISLKVPNKPGVNYFCFCLRLVKFLKSINSESNIVFDNLFGCKFFIILHKIKFKLISLSHGTPSSGFFSTVRKFGGGIRNLLYYLNNVLSRFKSGKLFRSSDAVISLSKYISRELIDIYRINPNKIHVIYNGCDCVSKNIIKHKKGSKLRVIFVGNDPIRKGIKVLYEVAKELKNENIVFYLIGMRSQTSELKNVVPLGKMSRDDLYKYMSDSDVIFLPSWAEGQPLVILEAMGFGCISVVSKACNMDMLEDTELSEFINENNSVEKYVDMFRKLLNCDIDKYRLLSQEIVKKYTWETQAKKYVELFDLF